jgi:hypothetical protein
MNELIGPLAIEKLLREITEYWGESKAPQKEKERILELVLEYYESRNLTEFDGVVANLTRGVLSQKKQLELFDEENQ